jgi:hypothetical protein
MQPREKVRRNFGKPGSASQNAASFMSTPMHRIRSP